MCPRLPLVAIVLLAVGAGCGGGGGRATGGAPQGDPPLGEGAFERDWVLIDRVASGNRIAAVALGPAGFVAITKPPSPGPKLVARQNLVAKSPDGVNWSERFIQPDGHYWSIAYGQGRYVAVGAEFPGGGAGLVIASEDGVQFREVARAATVLRRVRHTDAGFVAAGAQGAVLISADGEAWRESQAGLGQYEDVAFGRGRFLAVGQVMITSTDGDSWVTVPCGPQLPCLAVTDPSGGQHAVLSLHASVFANGIFLLTGAAGLLRSADGASWSRAGDARDLRLAYHGGLFLELSTLDRDRPLDSALGVSSSPDGITWQERTIAVPVRTDDTCATKRCLTFPSVVVLVP